MSQLKLEILFRSAKKPQIDCFLRSSNRSARSSNRTVPRVPRTILRVPRTIPRAPRTVPRVPRTIPRVPRTIPRALCKSEAHHRAKAVANRFLHLKQSTNTVRSGSRTVVARSGESENHQLHWFGNGTNTSQIQHMMWEFKTKKEQKCTG